MTNTPEQQRERAAEQRAERFLERLRVATLALKFQRDTATMWARAGLQNGEQQ